MYSVYVEQYNMVTSHQQLVLVGATLSTLSCFMSVVVIIFSCREISG